MDYTTFNKKTFFIAKNSTLPELKFPLIQKLKEMYNITDDMLDNVGITFSMIDADTGIYRIANAPASLVINKDRQQFPDEIKHTLIYRFKEKDTKKSGNYLGEFKIDFLDDEAGCGKITLPVNGYINIFISDSITKTTVI